MEVKLLYVGGGVELTEEREEADKVLRTVWRACWATLDTTQHDTTQNKTTQQSGGHVGQAQTQHNSR